MRIAGLSAPSTDDEVTGNHGSEDYWIVKLHCPVYAGIVSGDTSVCSGSQIIFVDTVAGGAWSVSNGNAVITDSLVTGVAAGTDTVIYTLTNSCGTATSAFPFTVETCPSLVKQVGNQEAVNVIPNPATSDIFVTGITNPNIVIYNTLGQAVMNVNGVNHVAVSALPPGLYFVRVFNTDGTLVRQSKVVKE